MKKEKRMLFSTGIKKAQNTILQIYKKVIKNPLTSDRCYGIIPLSPKRRVNDLVSKPPKRVFLKEKYEPRATFPLVGI